MKYNKIKRKKNKNSHDVDNFKKENAEIEKQTNSVQNYKLCKLHIQILTIEPHGLYRNYLTGDDNQIEHLDKTYLHMLNFLKYLQVHSHYACCQVSTITNDFPID